MARKVVLDVDPGVGDALAICLALTQPELEVVAVTATGGNVAPRQASRNVQAIIEHLDPPRWPRIGFADEEQPLRTDGRDLWGSDGRPSESPSFTSSTRRSRFWPRRFAPTPAASR
jgi:hypothetical protein